MRETKRETFLSKTISVFLIFTIASFAAPSWSSDDVDVLALASILIKNGNMVRADGVLNGVKDVHDVDTDEYYRLKGLLLFKQKKYDAAVSFLDLAYKGGLASHKEKRDEFLELYVRSFLAAKKFQDGHNILKKHQKTMILRAGYYQLMASTLFGLEQSEKGWKTLHDGIKKFPHEFALKKQKWFYLFEHNLLISSKNYILHILSLASEKDRLTGLDLIRMAHRYRQKNDLVTASLLGEMAFLKEPSNEDIVGELSRIYVARGQVLSAANLFESLAQFKPSYLEQASELWRKSGYLSHAKNLAYKIRKPELALKQKISLALDERDFGRISRFGPLVLRGDLKKNEEIQYTVAYAHFMTGDYQGVERYLKNIKRSDLFEKALALRKTIAKCVDKEWTCL